MNKLTDLEICKRIAEIEGVKVSLSVMPVGDELIPTGRGLICTDFQQYNPLEDDALCFQFAVELQLSLHYAECPAGSGRAYFVEKGGRYTTHYFTANKAVCMAKIGVFLNE